MNWNDSAAAVAWKVEPFVGGDYLKSTATESFDDINPANETVLCRVPVGSPADIDAAVKVARQRFNEGVWSAMPPGKRCEILLKLADLIVAHKAQLALLDTLEMGKPIQASLYDSEHFAPDLLRAWAGFADKLFGETSVLSSGSLSFNLYEPRGVVGAITPWNFPCVCAVYKFGPALAAGNSVVLKPSELSPSSALRLAELALEAGVPEGVLNVVPGQGATVGTALARHADVNMLSFTGSTRTGRLVMEYCARSNGKPLLLECGGKSPQVVFSDVSDLNAVADAVVQNVVWNQGQVCAAHTRLLVHEDIKDALMDKVVQRASTYHPADPLSDTTNFGPLASPVQRDRVKSYVEQGLKAGARPVLKGNIQESGGCYVSPTIFDRVDQSMSIVREEIFGPVLCVQSFSTDDEAVQLANSTEYGLAATVWTRDLGRAKRMVRAIQSGHVAVRTSGAEGPAPGFNLSFAPQKASGFGSEMGLQGLQSYSTLKQVVIKGD
jgi:acyl-CoA reductase-like NAD-dependent aldehyde dehydrogenase